MVVKTNLNRFMIGDHDLIGGLSSASINFLKCIYSYLITHRKINAPVACASFVKGANNIKWELL